MKSNESQLRQMFVRATDEVVPAAPWLEDQVLDVVLRRARPRRGSVVFLALRGSGSGVRFAAGVAAILIAVGAVAALLMSARLLHNSTTPGGRSTVAQTPSPTPIVPFIPSPAVRAGNWPPGGPVPAQLAGAWQPPLSSAMCKTAGMSGCILHLGGDTFQVGEEYPNGTASNGTIGPPLWGNVVVIGSEIDFISDICTAKADFGFERFTYTLNGNILVIAKAPGPGQSNCSWTTGASFWPFLAGTYTRVSAP